MMSCVFRAKQQEKRGFAFAAIAFILEDIVLYKVEQQIANTSIE
jgi:hypothetical protein